MPDDPMRVTVTVSVSGWGEDARISKVRKIPSKWSSSVTSGGYQRPDADDIRKQIEGACHDATVSTMGALDPEYRPTWT